MPDADAPGVGEGLVELLNPESTVTARQADAFSSLGRDHLNPKLRVAIRPTADFRSAPDRYPAHISMLFDVFPAEEISAGRFRREDAGAPVHGLLQEFIVKYTDDGNTVAWTRQPRHGQAETLSEAETITDLLSSLPEVFSAATATVATGQAGLSNRPQVTLALDNEDRTLIHQVHEVSDWVFTVDRNIGIEYFEHGGRGDRPDYLIEHTPSVECSLGHQVLITSRSLVEIEAMMRSVLEKFHLQAEGRHAAAILDNLRCLSGRLALKLISSPTHRTEALGLALARMYLAHHGIFADQIVVALDAHLELYREPRRHADELQDEVSLRRTDLALFDLNAATRTITCNLVEVKCYTETEGLSGYTQLRSTVAEQLEKSEQIIRLHFDPGLHSPDRLDRSFKTAEFAKLLEFSLDRSTRFRLLGEDAQEEARFFLRTLENGYNLAFTRSGLIFDFAKEGTDPPETEGGVEFHRVGIDVIRLLIDEAGPALEAAAVAGVEMAHRESGEAPSDSTLSGVSSSLLKLETAVFLPAKRDRSVEWDDLPSHGRVEEDRRARSRALPPSATLQMREPSGTGLSSVPPDQRPFSEDSESTRAEKRAELELQRESEEDTPGGTDRPPGASTPALATAIRLEKALAPHIAALKEKGRSRFRCKVTLRQQRTKRHDRRNPG